MVMAVAFACGACIGFMAAALCVAASGPTNPHAHWLGCEVAALDGGRWRVGTVESVGIDGSLMVRMHDDHAAVCYDAHEVPTRVVPA